MICGIIATDDFLSYTGGIIEGNNTENNSINHYVSIYGYGEANGTSYWIVQNSYGYSWGENGTFRILRGANTLGI